MAKGNPKNGVKNEIIFNLANEFGGIQPLAKALGVSFPNVSHWIRTDLPVPLRHAIKIEMLTQGKIKASKIRPDIMKGYHLTRAVNE